MKKKGKQKKGKPEGLEKRLMEKERRIEELEEEMAYLRAEFQNYSKSIDRQKREFEASANQELVRDLLVILDDFESALEKVNEGEARKGMEIIMGKLTSLLGKRGLKPIDCKEKTFDPYYHEAVMSVPSGEPEGKILEELQKGYMFNSNVIRHSKVKVAAPAGKGRKK